MPQHDVGVVDVSRRGVFKPLWETHGRFTRSLRDVLARGVELVFRVRRDVDCVAGETAAFPDETAFFGKKFGNFTRYKFVGYGCAGGRMFP